MEEITIQKDIYSLLQEARHELSQIDLKKSGYNAFAKFYYFELKDFLPTATKILNDKGICPIFSISVDDAGIEYAYMTLIKGAEKIQFKIPTAEPSQSNNAIQNLGSKVTYLRRYLWLCVMDIVENDSTDGLEQSKEKKDFATDFQVQKIFKNGALVKDILLERGIKTKNQIKEMSKADAEEIIKIIDEKSKG